MNNNVQLNTLEIQERVECISSTQQMEIVEKVLHKALTIERDKFLWINVRKNFIF